MSIWSKIFIVLLVVLVIAVSVSVMLVHRNAISQMNRNEQLQQDLSKANVALTTVTQQKSENEKTLQASLERLTENINTLNKSLADKQAEVKAKEVELQSAIRDLANAKLDSSQWSAVANNLTQERNRLAGQVSDLEKSQLALSKKYEDASQKLSELTAQKEFLLTQSKLQQQEIAMLRRQLAEAAAGEAASGVRTAVAAPAPTIKGQITGVSDDLATINVGQADGVEPGMRFTVFRADNYLAELIINRVQMNSAVGQLRTVKSRVQVDDKAWNKLEEH